MQFIEFLLNRHMCSMFLTRFSSLNLMAASDLPRKEVLSQQRSPGVVDLACIDSLMSVLLPIRRESVTESRMVTGHGKMPERRLRRALI